MYPAGPYHRVLTRIDHECPYIYTLPNDAQVRSNAHRIMMEDIRAREDDATRLQARTRIAGMALALGLEVMEVPGLRQLFLTCSERRILRIS